MKKIFKKLLRKPEDDFVQKSFSQDGEDILLNSSFIDLGGRDKGFYVDVGAFHPFRYSNTALFYSRGWSGINIEPTPTAIDLFKKHRKRDTNLNIGIGETHDSLTFYCFNEPALNSFSKTLSEERNALPNYKIINEITVKIYPLAEILDQYVPAGKKIDFMSIDVEGLDLQVLKSNNWDKYSPEFILAEDIVDFDNLSTSNVYSFLISKNYRLEAKTQRTMLFHYQGINAAV